MGGVGVTPLLRGLESALCLCRSESQHVLFLARSLCIRFLARDACSCTFRHGLAGCVLLGAVLLPCMPSMSLGRERKCHVSGQRARNLVSTTCDHVALLSRFAVLYTKLYKKVTSTVFNVIELTAMWAK